MAEALEQPQRVRSQPQREPAKPPEPVGPGEYRAVAEAFAREVKKRFGSRVNSIRLYGSVARGDNNKFSDIDVLVTTEEKEWYPLHWDISEVVVDFLLRHGVLISVKVINEEDFHSAVNEDFFLNVNEEGIALG